MTSPLSQFIDHRTKGIPGLAGPFSAAGIADMRWNVLAGDMPLPVAVLKETTLERNAKWIMEFARRSEVSLCPHGKTTMCPQIFQRQLAHGAWGITLSTPHQIHTARDFGIGRILMANQLIDPTLTDYLAAEMDQDPEFDFYCLVDSIAGVGLLENRLAQLRATRPVQVLLEVGMMGGRTGCRSHDDAMAVAAAVGRSPHLRLRGVEGFEGILPEAVRDNPHPVQEFLKLMRAVAVSCDEAHLFADGEVILSAGGSAYFDIVARILPGALPHRPVRVVIRSGCYVSHDSDMYVSYFNAIESRSALVREIGWKLQPALEVLAYVQSRPEPELALLTVGKRDCSYDHHLPKPLVLHTGPGRTGMKLDERYVITSLNDQHAYLRIPPNASIAIGDIVSLGVSHPCTTFDKWDVLYGVDDDYTVSAAYKTYF